MNTQHTQQEGGLRYLNGTPLDLYVVDLLRISLDRGHLVVNVLYLIDLKSGVARFRGSLLLARLREGCRPEKR